MTSRGNSSISPPVQISVQSQQRQVTAIPSGTPPPQQHYFQGQTSIPQGVYEFHTQNHQAQQSGQQLLSYQAYGSTPNEIRVSGGSGRGGPPQQGLAQGGAFYQQPNQNMRPQQQPQTQQPYYISTQPSNIRPQRPQQTLFMLPPQATGLPTGGNVVISPPAQNMYSARVPLFTPPTGYQYINAAAAAATNNYQTMYYQSSSGSMMRGPVVTQTSRAGPPQREKRLIEIKDPTTGRDLTAELCQRPQSADSTVEEEPQANNQKGAAVQAEFARRVAEQLQTPPGNGNQAPPPVEQQSQPSSENGLPNAHYQQQKQPQVAQNRHQPHMIQPGQNPNMMQMGQDMMGPGRPPMKVNLNVPPPALPNQQGRQANAPIFIPQQQQPQAHAPNQYVQQAPQHAQQHAPQHAQQHAPQQVPPQHAQQAPPQHAQQAPPQHAQHVPQHAQQAPPHAQQAPPHAQQAPPQHVQQAPPHVQQMPPQHVQQAPPQHVQQAPPQHANQAPPQHTQVPPPQHAIQVIPTVPVVPSQQAQTTQSQASSQSQALSHEVSHQHVPHQAQAPSQQQAPPPQMQAPPQPQIKMVQPDIVKGSTSPLEVAPSTPPPQSVTPPVVTQQPPPQPQESIKVQSSENVVPSKAPVIREHSEPLAAPEKTVQEATQATEHIPNTAVSKEKSTSPPKEPAAPIPAAGEPAATIVKEMTPPAREDSSPKTEDSTGASIQPKDARKNKKKGRKDIGGSEMDAFIDGKDNESIEAKPPLPPAAVDRQTSAERSTVQEVKPVFSYAAAATLTEKTKESSPIAASPEDKKPADAEKESEKISAPEITKSSDLNQNQQKEKSPTPVIIEPAAPQNDAESTTSQPAVPEQTNETKTPVVKSTENKNVVEVKSEVEKSVNDENVPPERDTTMESKIDVQVVPRVTRDENGRLVYDRSYLMELRGTERSQARPDNLPDLEIILDAPMQAAPPTSKRGASMTGPDFTPSFFQPGVGSQRHPPPMGKSSSRGRPGPGDRDNMGGRMGPPQKVITRQSMGNDVKPLHQAEKPWMPSVKSKEEKEVKSLEQETLFIMNRLTPTNFERLAGEMRKLKVNTYEDLQELVKIFFDKVTIETKFVSAYAQLCKVMAQLKVPPPAGLKETQATFRVVMLTKCQQEFEADKAVVFEDPDKKRKELEAEISEDTPKRKEKIDFTLYQMKLRRLKFYGNIRFIGELFKLGMLTENIMHDCIFRLLKARDDDSLLSLCNLVGTVGKHLDTDKAKTRMDQYFVQMGKIAEERKSRIKFTLKDVLELRMNNWKPRKGETGPKKIDEVHKDFEAEQATKQFLNNQPPPPRNDNQMPNNRRNSKQRQEEKPPTDDGWNTVGSRTMKLDPGKMRLSKPSAVDENSIQLGPGGGMAKFGMWSRGSFGGSTQQPQSQDERQTAPNNRFNALRDDKGRQFERSPSRENNGRGMRQGSQGHNRGKISRSSQEGERRDVLASARSIVGARSQNSSRDNSWNREDRRQTFGPRSSHERDNPMTRSDITPRSNEEFRTPAPPAPIKVKGMNEEEMESKAKNILEEYLNIRDLPEAKLCVTELAGQPLIHLFVTACLNDVLEKNAKDRELTGQLLNELIKSNKISVETYAKGLSEVTTYAEDMVIDIPMMWPNLAQLITPLLVGGSVSMSKLMSVLKATLEKRCTAQLLAQIMLQLKEKVGEDATAQIWQSSGCNWADFIPSADVNGFLKDKKIEFVTKTVSGAADDSKNVWQKLSDDVEAMIRGGKNNGEIKGFIEKTIGKETQSKNFIRALTTAVASASMSKPPNALKANEEVIKARKDILQYYIQSNTEQELQALYAIQALMTKLEHPSGVISCLFDTLYDEEVISEESCKQWEKSTDSAEQEGKGVCSMQLTQFFTWLSENDEIENS